MSISQSDITLRLSGGASNALPNSSLGGVKSSVSTPVGIFDKVEINESTAGDIEYRCAYVHNGHATLTLLAAVLWMAANTPSATTTVEVGIGSAALNGVEQTVADENTAPAGVTFFPAASVGAGVALGDIPPGQGRSVWFRRTINPGTVAANDTYTARVTGGTEA